MRIVAIADTHLNTWKIPEKLKELLEDADLVVHAGDFDKYEIYKKFNSNFELIAVQGNSDEDKIKRILPKVQTFKVENVKFGVVHKGNYLNQFHDLGYRAKELGVDFLIFGHIHRFVLDRLKDVTLLCPGSPTMPRLSVASCAEIVVEGKNVSVKHHVVQNLFCGIDVYKMLTTKAHHFSNKTSKGDDR